MWIGSGLLQSAFGFVENGIGYELLKIVPPRGKSIDRRGTIAMHTRARLFVVLVVVPVVYAG
jgi:hypothetical protein